MKNLDEINRLLSQMETELRKLDTRRSELLKKRTELQQIKASFLQRQKSFLQPTDLSPVNDHSSEEDKIALYRGLFRGREDVYPRRFESLKTGKKGYSPVCRNEWINGICEKPKIRCDNCAYRKFLPVTDNVVRSHLLGKDPQDKSSRDFTIGVYPMLTDETCWFLAADFDKTSWQEDALAFIETCKRFDVLTALERSRSGNGGHVWIFFSESIPATIARKMGTFILTQTMELRPDIGLDSYDRFFPNQDTLPQGGFGNLIALPLQKKPRKNGYSLFVDERFIEYHDQWAFLSSIQRMNRKKVEIICSRADRQGEFLGVRIPVTNENDNEPWNLSPSRKSKDPSITGPFPKKIELVHANQIYVPKTDLTPSLRNHLIRIAAFQNPEFYKAQAMRLSTFGKPRIISCCEDFPEHLGLPRGCLDELLDLFQSLKIKVNFTDHQVSGTPIKFRFQGDLREEQQQAANALLQHEKGVLAASTAFGKTIVAAYLVAQRKVSTLVIVHRRHLLDQWAETLSQFLDIEPKEIGQIRGGKYNPTEKIDVAMVQSLIKKGIVDDIIGKYGHIIIDECHHISAVSFEQVVRQAKARYLTGLSATVVRKDGHHPIIFMQCGPIRYRVDDRKQAEKRPFDHKVIIRATNFYLPSHLQNVTSLSIQDIYTKLAENEDRNIMIVEDVITAVQAKRFPVLLTERRDHLDLLAGMLEKHIRYVIVMRGGMGKKQQKQLKDQITGLHHNQPRVIVATGRYLGEGFDDKLLDTLFLSLPISWRGTLTQYAGRLHRLNETKKDVIIYDYVDFEVPVLAKMYGKRQAGYKAIGYKIELPEDNYRSVQNKTSLDHQKKSAMKIAH